MKIKFAFVLCSLFLFFSIGLHAQSSNNEQRIIGAWTVIISDASGFEGSIWTFNTNGTYSIRMSGHNITGKYLVAGSKLHMENLGVIDIIFSSDGSSMILSDNSEQGFSLRKN